LGADGAAGVSCAQATSDQAQIKANNPEFHKNSLFKVMRTSGVVRLTCGRRKKYQKKAKESRREESFPAERVEDQA